MANDPSTVSHAVEEMRGSWELVEALLGGTCEMREEGEKYLPRFPKEDAKDYKRRLQASTLLPAYAETIQNNTGRVFAEPITIGDDVPESIATLIENIDQQGNNLQVWARKFFHDGLAYGLSFALVDFPRAEGIRTQADEIRLGVRPYVVTIEPEQVLGWKTVEANGSVQLSQFRYKEAVEEEDPENIFATVCIEQIRVLEPGLWQVYRKVKGDDGKERWEIYDEGTTTLEKIPLVVFYTKRTGFMTATPPLLELAHLNVKHWQSQSDQDNVLHIARVPIMVRIGAVQPYDAEGKPVPLEFQVGGALNDLPKEGDMKYVEHSGKAIEAGRQSLLDLEDQMRMAGAKLLQKEKQATKTAAQAEEEAAQELSPLQMMAACLEDAIDQILQLMADWTKAKEGGHVEVHGNFDVDYAPETTLPLLKSMTDSGYLSEETLFHEVQRRGVISGDLTWEDESGRITSQPPRLGAL